MSSDVSNASYTLDNSGINIQFDLKDFTLNTIVNATIFTNITDSFTISNYSNYDLVPFNVSAISNYSCNITNKTVLDDVPLVEY
jgi:polyisoprenoid-binding protein YceI